MKHIKLFENFNENTKDEFYYLVVDELVELGYGFDSAENLIAKHNDIYHENSLFQEHRDQSSAKNVAQSIEEAEMQADEDEEDFNESLDSNDTNDDDDDIHRCDACKEVMSQGYVINGGEEYFCSNICLHTKYSQEEYEEMYADINDEHDYGNGDETSDTYWTEWTDEPTVRTTNQIEEGD